MPYTKKQKGLFGLIRGGGKPKRLKSGRSPLSTHYRSKS